MLQGLPSVAAFADWSWEQMQPFTDELLARLLTAENVVEWWEDWMLFSQYVGETYSRLNVATTLDTTDQAAEDRFIHFVETVIPPFEVANQKLKEKLLETGLQPPGYDISLRNMRAEADLFREANVPLEVEETKLGTEYDKVIGAQTVEWAGEEKTIAQMQPVIYFHHDRAEREAAWRKVAARQLADRETLNDLWVKFYTLRQQIAKNADLPDYRAYAFRKMGRFDYSPEDCLRFHTAIENAVVPAATRLYEKRRIQLGVEALRPWDSTHTFFYDPTGRDPLKPFEDVDVLKQTTSGIFHKVDPQLGDYYDIMQRDQLLDLDNRKGKAPGGYMTSFDVTERPFIFMNAVGMHDDVQTLLHEGGHAFHDFESTRALPRSLRMAPPMEFAEVASMSMELLAAPYLTRDEGGFYDESEAARARISHLESIILFWPYMAVVDAFQHWAYTNREEACDPALCDAEWSRQWDRFMPGVDYTGLETIKATGWHRKLHIFQVPFYYVEYGLAQLGAVQVYGNALRDQAKAVADYRAALALGGTRTLPELFSTAGARFAMDTETLQQAVDLVEGEIGTLEDRV